MIRRMAFLFVTVLSIFFFHHQVAFAKTPVNYDQLLPIAKKYIGIPYMWGGSKPSGFDCSGYITYVFQQLDINLPRTTQEMSTAGAPVNRSELRIGDLVFFNTYGTGITHAGIYIGNNQFIHSQEGKGVSISLLNDPFYWSKHFVGATRVLDYSLNVGSFQDVKPNYWAYEAVHTLSEKEIVVGYEKSFFLPEEKITRAEVAALMAEALDLDVSNRSTKFNDVPSDYWAVGAINALYKEGIVKGDSLGNFNPEGVLKREHVAIMFNNAFKLGGTSSEAISFRDVKASSPSYEAIRNLAASGVTTGYSDNTFKPRDDVKRSQYVAFLYRALY